MTEAYEYKSRDGKPVHMHGRFHFLSFYSKSRGQVLPQ
jgi:hypothetical protein